MLPLLDLNSPMLICPHTHTHIGRIRIPVKPNALHEHPILAALSVLPAPLKTNTNTNDNWTAQDCVQSHSIQQQQQETGPHTHRPFTQQLDSTRSQPPVGP